MSSAYLLKEKVKQALNNLFTPKQKVERKMLLIKCLERLGYILEPIVNPMTVEQQELEAFMRGRASSSSSSSDSESEDFTRFQQPQFRQSIQEQNQSSNLPGKTFIQSLPGQSDRLSVLNQRGTTSIEQEQTKINEIFAEVLSKIPDTESVKTTAFNIYQQIENAYRQGLIDGELKATARKGFIFLSVYYALLEHGIYQTREELVDKFDGKIKIRDIPGSEKKMFKAFSDPDNAIYQLMHRPIHETNLCGMTEVLSEQQILNVRNGITELKEKGVINSQPSLLEIAAIIHKFAGIGLKTIGGYCGARPDTLRKAVDNLNG
jgi:hypothetical protein